MAAHSNGPVSASSTTEERVVNLDHVQVNGDQGVFPSDSKIAASYQWSKRSTRGNPRTIAPGTLRKYAKPRNLEFSLKRDPNAPIVDENKDKMSPFSSAVPLLHAIGACSPELNMDTIDIVTDRNNLRNLLLFCGSPGTSSGTPDNIRAKPFSFHVHGIGEVRDGKPTLVFTRVISGREVHYPGYSGGFEDRLTEKDPSAPGDAGRFSAIVEMKLDGVSLLVRSKPDAYEPAPKTESSARRARDAEDDLSEKFGSLPVFEGGKGKTTSGDKEPSSSCRADSFAASGLTCTQSGELLGNDDQLLEFKTKNSRHADEINWKDLYWQMVLGGTAKMVLGLHERGCFDNVQEFSINEVKNRADNIGSSSMVYLANTLREVVEAAHLLMAGATASLSGGKESDGPRPAVVVVYSPSGTAGGGTLRVRLANGMDKAVAP